MTISKAGEFAFSRPCAELSGETCYFEMKEQENNFFQRQAMRLGDLGYKSALALLQIFFGPVQKPYSSKSTAPLRAHLSDC